MNNFEKIKLLLEQNNGILYVKELEENNIHRQYLKILEEKGEIIRILKGVYIDNNKDVNEFFIMSEKYKNLNLLYKYAKEFKIDKILKKYMEVLD